MNRKGFTLIELLTVIVILAVIALIASPLIMGTITKAKKNAAIDSAYGYIRSMETSIGKIHVEDASKIMEQDEITFTVSDNGQAPSCHTAAATADGKKACRMPRHHLQPHAHCIHCTDIR